MRAAGGHTLVDEVAGDPTPATGPVVTTPAAGHDELAQTAGAHDALLGLSLGVVTAVVAGAAAAF